MRRAAAAALFAVFALAACQKPLTRTDDRTPPLNTALLEDRMAAIRERAGAARLGAAVRNFSSGETWTLNGDQAFPLGGLAVLPVAASALAERNAGRLSLDETVPVKATDLTPPPSALAETWRAGDSYVLGDLMKTALAEDDTLALDLLTRRVGGPGAVTGWLRLKSLQGLRVDRYQRELETERLGLSPFRPAWRGRAAFGRVTAALPPSERRAALDRYLADPRDTTTPAAAVKLLAGLADGALLSHSAYADLTAALPVRADDPALPKGARFTGRRSETRTDAARPVAMGEIGYVTLADGRIYLIAILLSGSNADVTAQAAILDDTRSALIQAAR